MKDRLSKILTAEGLTSALLADKMGIQRSGISHILSGRNYPSFDFLQKLLENFPRLNAEWLILGQGSMYKSTLADQPDFFTSSDIAEKVQMTPVIPEKSQDLSSGEDHKNELPLSEPKKSTPAEPQKIIEKMMILYTDKTFDIYFPESKSLQA